MEVSCGAGKEITMRQNYEKQINNILKTIHALPEQVQKATILALNRTSEWLKGRVAKDISREKRIKLKIIRDKIKVLKADKRNIQANLNCNFQNIPIIDLGKVRQNAIGAVVGNMTFPHAFIATMHKGGKQNVYRRTTKKRFPVKVVKIPIYNDAIKIIEDLLGIETKQIFEKRFLHEIIRISGVIA